MRATTAVLKQISHDNFLAEYSCTTYYDNNNDNINYSMCATIQIVEPKMATYKLLTFAVFLRVIPYFTFLTEYNSFNPDIHFV